MTTVRAIASSIASPPPPPRSARAARSAGPRSPGWPIVVPYWSDRRPSSPFGEHGPRRDRAAASTGKDCWSTNPAASETIPGFSRAVCIRLEIEGALVRPAALLRGNPEWRHRGKPVRAGQILRFRGTLTTPVACQARFACNPRAANRGMNRRSPGCCRLENDSPIPAGLPAQIDGRDTSRRSGVRSRSARAPTRLYKL